MPGEEELLNLLARTNQSINYNAEDELASYVRNTNPLGTPDPMSDVIPVNASFDNRDVRVSNYGTNISQPNFGRFDDEELTNSIKKAKTNIEEYTAAGKFDIGSRVTDFVSTYAHQQLPPENRSSYARTIREASGKDLSRTIIKESYKMMDKADRDYLVNLAYSHFISKNSPEMTYFVNRRMGNAEREADLLSATVDYVAETGDGSSDLIAALKASNFLKEKPAYNLPEKVSPLTSQGKFGLFTTIGDAVTSLWKDDTDKNDSYSHFMSYLYDQKISNQDKDFFNVLKLNQLDQTLKQFEDRNTVSTNDLARTRQDMRRELASEVEGDENYFLTTLNVSEISDLKRVGKIRDLDTRTFLESLVINHADLGVQHHMLLPGYGEASKARQLWSSLGLSTDQQDTLEYVLKSGLKGGGSPTLGEIATEAEKQIEIEKEVDEWLKEEGERFISNGWQWPPDNAIRLPSRFSGNKYLSNEFLVKRGIDPQKDDGFSVAGTVWSPFGWGIGWVIAGDEFTPDNVYEKLMSESGAQVPRDLMGTEDTPWNRYTRKTGHTAGGNWMDTVGDYFDPVRLPQKIIQKIIDPPIKQLWTDGIPKGVIRTPGQEADMGPFGEIRGAGSLYLGGNYIDHPRYYLGKIPVAGTLFKKIIPSYSEGQVGIRNLNVSASFREAFPNISEKDFAHFEGHKHIRDSLINERSKEGGMHRVNLAYIYQNIADEEERRELEDAGSGLFELHWERDGTLNYSNMELFVDLVRNKNYTIRDALNEAVTLAGTMRAGWTYSTFAPLDVLGGILGKGFKATAAAARSGSRLQQLSNYVPDLKNLIDHGDKPFKASMKETDKWLQDLTKVKETLTTSITRRNKNVQVISTKMKNLPEHDVDKPLILSKSRNEKQLRKNILKFIKGDETLREIPLLKRIIDAGSERNALIDQVVEILNERARLGGKYEAEFFGIPLDDVKYEDYVPWELRPFEKPIGYDWALDRLVRSLRAETYAPTRPYGELPISMIEEVGESFPQRFRQSWQGVYTVPKGALPSTVDELHAATLEIESIKAAITAAKAESAAKNIDQVDIDLSGIERLKDIVLTSTRFLDTEYSLKNFFRVEKALGRQAKLVSLREDVSNPEIKSPQRKYGKHEFDIPDPSNIGGWLKKNLFGRGGEGPINDRVIAVKHEVERTFGTEILTSYAEEFAQIDSTDQHLFIGGILQAIIDVGKKDTAALYYEFINKSRIGNGQPTERLFKALDVLKDIDLKKMPVLKAGPKTPEELYIWNANFDTELGLELERILKIKYGVDGDVGTALSIQNAINKYASMLYLARPSFVIRNFVTNISTMVVDGTQPSDVMALKEKEYTRLLGDVPWASSAQSAAELGADAQSLGPVRGQSIIKQAAQVMIGSADERVMRQKSTWRRRLRRLKGDGIPGLGGTPLFYAKQLSGFMEATHRRNIRDKAFRRYFDRMANTETLSRRIDELPNLSSILNDPQMDPDGQLKKLIIENLQNPGSNGVIDSTFVIRQLGDVEEQLETIFGTFQSPQRIIESLGYEQAGLLDLGMGTKLKEILNEHAIHSGKDPLLVIERMIKQVEQMRQELYETNRLKGNLSGFDTPETTNIGQLTARQSLRMRNQELEEIAKGNIPESAFELTPEELAEDMNLQLFEMFGKVFVLFRDHLSGGDPRNVTPDHIKIADALAKDLVMRISRPIRAIEEAKNLILETIGDPDIYEDAVYGYGKDIFNILDEPAEFLTNEMIKEEMTKRSLKVIKSFKGLKDDPNFFTRAAPDSDSGTLAKLPEEFTGVHTDQQTYLIHTRDLHSEVYHVTSNKGGIEDRGGILAITEDNSNNLQGTGIGGPVTNTVSATQNKQQAENLEREMKRRVRLFNTTADDLTDFFKKLIAEDRRLVKKIKGDKVDPRLASDELIDEKVFFKELNEKVKEINAFSRWKGGRERINTEVFDPVIGTLRKLYLEKERIQTGDVSLDVKQIEGNPLYERKFTKKELAEIVNIHANRQSILVKENLLDAYYAMRESQGRRQGNTYFNLFDKDHEDFKAFSPLASAENLRKWALGEFPSYRHDSEKYFNRVWNDWMEIHKRRSSLDAEGEQDILKALDEEMDDFPYDSRGYKRGNAQDFWTNLFIDLKRVDLDNIKRDTWDEDIDTKIMDDDRFALFDWRYGELEEGRLQILQELLETLTTISENADQIRKGGQVFVTGHNLAINDVRRHPNFSNMRHRGGDIGRSKDGRIDDLGNKIHTDETYIDKLLSLTEDDIGIVTIPKETLPDEIPIIAYADALPDPFRPGRGRLKVGQKETEPPFIDGEIEIFSDVYVPPAGQKQRLTILPEGMDSWFSEEVEDLVDHIGWLPVERLIDDATGVILEDQIGREIPLHLREVPTRVEEAANRMKELVAVARETNTRHAKVINEDRTHTYLQLKSTIQTQLKGRLEKEGDLNKLSDEAKGSLMRQTLLEILQHQDIRGAHGEHLIKDGGQNWSFNAETISKDFLTRQQRQIFTTEIIDKEILKLINDGDLITAWFLPATRPPLKRDWWFDQRSGRAQPRDFRVPENLRIFEENAWINRNRGTDHENVTISTPDRGEYGAFDKAYPVIRSSGYETGFFTGDPLSIANWKKEFVDNWHILAQRATMLKLSDPSLQKKADELSTYLNKLENAKIEKVFTLIDEIFAQRLPLPSLDGKAFNEKRETFVEAVEELFQGVGKEGQDKGFVEEAGPKINELFEAIGLDSQQLDLRNNGQHFADTIGRSIWHDQTGHAFEQHLITNGAQAAFLKDLSQRLTAELRQARTASEGPADVLREDSVIYELPEAIRKWDEQQAIRFDGLHLDSEFDDELIRRYNQYITVDNLPDDLRSVEHRASSGVYQAGLPRNNSWSDIEKYADGEIPVEVHLNLEAVTGRESKYTVSLPLHSVRDEGIMPITTPEGLTRDTAVTGDITRRGRFLSPAQEFINNENEFWTLPGSSFRYRGDEAILPAPFGMGPQTLVDGTIVEGVPPQSVSLRQFLVKPPEGYIAVFGNDSMKAIPEKTYDDLGQATETGRYFDARRIGFFLKEGASEKDIEIGLIKLVRYQKQSKKRAKKIGWDLRQKSRADWNWSGYRASWSGSVGVEDQDTPNWAFKGYFQSELKRIINKIDDLRNPESEYYQELEKSLKKKGFTDEKEVTIPARLRVGEQVYVEGESAPRAITRIGTKGELAYEISLHRRALEDIAEYAVNQWQKGGPPYGQGKSTLEEILPTFVGFKRRADRVRVIEGRSTFSADPSKIFGDVDSPLYTKSVRLSQKQVDNVLDDIDTLRGDIDRMRAEAAELGAAQADYILHDYNNTNNVDYIARWMGPWHIWQTRTAAKTALALAENPALLSRFEKLMTTQRDINRRRNVAKWNEFDAPIGLAAEPFISMAKALGADDDGWIQTVEHFADGATVNLDAVIFTNSMYDYYPTAGRPAREGDDVMANFHNMGFFGKVGEAYQGGLKMPFGPHYSAILGLSGQYGPDYSFKEKVVKPLIRVPNIGLTAVDKLLPYDVPLQLMRTNSDIRAIDNMYLQTVFELSLSKGYDSQEVQELMDSWQEFALTRNNASIEVPLLSFINETFGSEIDHPAHAEIVKAANNRGLARTTTSVLTGFPLSLGHRKIIDPKTGREVNVFDTLSEYYDLIKSRKSKGEKDKALKEFFKEHPYIREYLNYKKLGNDAGNQIKVATATSLKYDGMDKLFIDKRVELDKLQINMPVASIDSFTRTEDLLTNPEAQREFVRIQKKFDDGVQELQEEIYRTTGINTGLSEEEYGIIHPNFKADKREFGNEQLFYNIIEENLYNDEMFMTLFADDPAAGLFSIKKIIDLAHSGSYFKGYDEEKVLTAIEELNKNRIERYGAPLDTEFITVGMLNAWQMQSFVQSIRQKRDLVSPRMYTDAFYEKYAIRGSNVVDWPQYYRDRETWENSFKTKTPKEYELFRTYEAANATLPDTIDRAIEDIMQEDQELINSIYSDSDNAIDISLSISLIEEFWTSPTVDDVLNWLDTNYYGNTWTENKAYSQEEIVTTIRERLERMEDVTFADVRDGRWEYKESRLREQLEQGTDKVNESHFWSPNKELIINNKKTLDEFSQARAFNEELRALSEEGLQYLGLDPTNNPVHLLYMKYYRDGGEIAIAQSMLVDQLYKEGEPAQAQAAKELFEERNRARRNISDFEDASVVDFGKPASGIRSRSSSPSNIGRNYQLYDLGQNPAMSHEAANLRMLMVSRFYKDKPDVAGNLVFEHFARNGVADRESIIDMWETLFYRFTKLYPDLKDMTDIKPLVSSLGDSQDSQLATYQFINGLGALLAKVTGYAPVQQRNYRTPLRNITNRQSETVSTSGAGGLPTWDAVVKHIDTVFRDPSFKEALIKYLITSDTKLSKNHERILRAMHRTYPIGVGYTFSKWVEALRLIYKTKVLVGVGTSRPTSGRNPTFSYPSNVPRLAKRRD